MQIDTAHRRLSAIMFSDICGFSRMMGENEAHTMSILAKHDKLVNEAIGRFQGNVIKRMGDGVLAEFQSAVGAVECALAIQRSLRVYNSKADNSQKFELRIGVHLGDVVVSGDDILGDGVNVASRIEPLAEPGGICISQDVYNQIQNKVEIEVVSIGPKDLKNIRRQIEIFRVLVAATDRDRAVAMPQTPKGTVGRKPWLKWVVVAAAAILVLLVLLVGLGKARKARQRRWAAAVLSRAEALLGEEKPAEAMNILEKALHGLPPSTPGYERMREAAENARTEVHKARIRERFAGFVRNLWKKNWDACMDCVDVRSIDALGSNGVRYRIQALFAMFSLTQLSPDDIRITDVRFDREAKTASAATEVRRKGQWQRTRAGKWRMVDGQWYIAINRGGMEERSADPKRFGETHSQGKPGAIKGFPKKDFSKKGLRKF